LRAVGRLFAAIVGFVLSLVAAAGFLFVVWAGIETPPPGEEAWRIAQLTIWVGAAAATLGAMAFVPAVVLIVVTEIFALRSIVLHVGAGGLMGLAAVVLSPGAAGPAALDRGSLLMVAAGFVGGFVYWLVAGRMAGLEPGPRRDDPPSPVG
jgi:hypothetical protein